MRDHVDHALHDFARTEEFNQFTGPVHGLARVFHIQTFFETGGGVGTHAERCGGAADGRPVEAGALKQDHGRVADDLAVLAAHHARNAYGFFRIADAEHGGRELTGRPVKGAHGLALPGAAHMDLAVFHTAEIKGVHRLPVLEHDIVRDVHDVIDGPHAGVPQPLPHPGGRRSDLHVFHHTGRIAGAEGIVLDEDLRHVADVPFGFLADSGLMELQLLAEGHCGLTRQTDHAEAVRAVRGDLELHHMVIHAEQLPDIRARSAVLVEDQDPVGDAVRELLLLCMQVFGRADAAFCRIVGHQISLMEIGASGHEFCGRFQRAVPEVDAGVLHPADLCGDHAAVDFVTGADIRGNGGSGRIQGMVVSQDGRGNDRGIGEIMGRGIKLLQGAEHAFGLHTAEFSAGDLRTPRQKRIMECNGHHVPRVHVPGTCADLHGRRRADIQLCHQHMVGVGMLLQ